MHLACDKFKVVMNDAHQSTSTELKVLIPEQEVIMNIFSKAILLAVKNLLVLSLLFNPIS